MPTNQLQYPAGLLLFEFYDLDDACLGGERSSGMTGRGSENENSFAANAQTTALHTNEVTHLHVRA